MFSFFKKKKEQESQEEPPAVRCDWCNEICKPDEDGFHVVHVAFGRKQERYFFCNDECYEAFRKLYPSRIHRNCYDHPCANCDLCEKTYPDEAEGIRELRESARKKGDNGSR